MHSGQKDNDQADQRQGGEAQGWRLWKLTLVAIALPGITLSVLDFTDGSRGWWLGSALDTSIARVGLASALLLMCAYFVYGAEHLRRENSKLISNLEATGSQLEKKDREVALLKELSDDLLCATDLEEALDLVLGVAVQVAGADSASVMLREKNSDVLHIVASRGLSPEIVRSTRVKVGEAIAGRVAQEGKPVIINSDELAAPLAGRLKRGNAIVSSVVIPVKVGNDIRGVVNTAKRRGGVCFSEEDLRVLVTLANQASMLIQKTDLRNELIQADKLASMGRLAGGVAHEMNNPLQVILGRIEMLLESETDEQKKHGLNAIRDYTTRIQEIVSNLLSFARQTTTSQFRDMDINTVIERTMSLLEPQIAPDNINVLMDIGRDVSPIRGCAGQLQQVLTNVVMNAYHAMRSQGGGTLTVRSYEESGMVSVEVSDTGPGISEEYVDHIFEPFFTTKPEGEGTGLGLSIAYGIMRSHNGAIQVSSSSRGTRITLAIPAKAICDAGRRLDRCNGEANEEFAA